MSTTTGAAATITQVRKDSKSLKRQSANMSDTLHLNLRGTRFVVDKTTLRSTPETILKILFPQGLLPDAKEYKSELDPKILAHIINFYKTHKSKFLTRLGQFDEDAYLAHAVVSGMPLNPLLTKQGIVVLLEELVYFVICCRDHLSSSMKQTSLKLLLEQNLIFNDAIHNDDADDDDFIKTLCLAGFSKWQVRSQKPNKSCIQSIALASIEYEDRLRIGPQMMMFHSNPTTKCWWSKTIIPVNNTDNEDNQACKLWCRRAWTLEFVLL